MFTANRVDMGQLKQQKKDKNGSQMEHRSK